MPGKRGHIPHPKGKKYKSNRHGGPSHSSTSSDRTTGQRYFCGTRMVIRGGHTATRGGGAATRRGDVATRGGDAATHGDPMANMDGVSRRELVHPQLNNHDHEDPDRDDEDLDSDDEDPDREDEDSEHDNEDLDQRESSFADTPHDTSQKPRIARVGPKFGSNLVHRSITRIFREHHDKAWISIKQVPQDVLDNVYSRFRTLWSWDSTVEERIYEGFVNVLKYRFRDILRRLRLKSIKKAEDHGKKISRKDPKRFKILRNYPPDTVPPEMWRELCKGWGTDAWLKKSDVGKNNRDVEDGNGKSSRHTGGSIGFDERRMKMKRKMGEEPSFLQVFLDTHLTKKAKAKLWAEKFDLHSLEGADFCTQRAQEAYEAYLSEMIKIHGKDFTRDDPDVWMRVQGDGCTSRIYGIGSSDLNFVMTGLPSSSCGATPSYAEYQQSQEKVQGLESQLLDLGTQLENEKKSREELEQRIEQNERAQQQLQQKMQQEMQETLQKQFEAFVNKFRSSGNM